jgi:hypothetical protein
MKKADISEVLESIQNQVEKIEDRETKKIVSVLYNLVEEVVSDNTSLLKENQAYPLTKNFRRKLCLGGT